MPKIRLNSICLPLTLFIAQYASLGPLNAWVDHFFDFHLAEIEQDWNGSKAAWKENDVWAEIGQRDQDRDRDSDRGTCPDGPDRDK